MYDTILIPTDGSEQADRGINHGLDLATQYDATVLCLYVVDERRYGRPPALGTVEVDHEKHEDEAIELLKEIEDRGRERGVDVTHECRRGNPWDEIVTFAEREDVDLIVMGRRGVTDDRRTPLGSVTEQVMRQTEIPVQAV